MKSRFSGTVLYLYSSLVYRTCRFSISGLDELDDLRDSGKPLILTSWHGMTMMIVGLIRNYLDVRTFNVITPDDQRGDVLGVFARHLGVKSIPLDLSGDSTMGTGKKLVALIRDLKRGRNFLIHPDGPAGPAYHVKPGLVYIAQKAGARILPLGCYCRHAYHIPRWDRYTLPLPFSKVQIQIGEVIEVPLGPQPLDEISREMEALLNRLTFQAAANYYE